MKVVENSPQNAQICTIFLNFLMGGGGMPPKPPSKGSQLSCSRHAACISKITKKLKLGPPLRNPAYAPECNTITNIKIGMRLTLQLITNR